MFGILKALKKGIASGVGSGVGSGTGSGSISQIYGSADLDPHQKVKARIPNTDTFQDKSVPMQRMPWNSFFSPD
jgi:hypothetical protein